MMPSPSRALLSKLFGNLEMAKNPVPPVKLNIGASKEVAKTRTQWQEHFAIIRQACITLGFSLGVAALLIGGTHYFYLKQKEKQEQAQSELVQAQGKYANATNEKDDIRDYQPRYLQLLERGFVGDEKRLDIVELMQSIQAKYRLLPMSYEISPQQVVALDPSMNNGELELRASKLVLQMNLLHEMDMFNLFNELHQKGQFIHQSCDIKTGTTLSALNLPRQLEAKCSLQWMTMGRRPNPELAPAAPVQ